MPRISRKLLVDWESTHHCTFRSHNGMDLFVEEAVAEEFLRLLATYKAKYGIRIHSFCLMSNHPHLVLSTSSGQPSFSGFWQVVNACLAKFVNRRLGRRGQVVMERLRSPRIQAQGGHMLTVMRYGDLNPVRAGLVKSPSHWKYSSYRHYAFGEKHPLLDDAPDYLALGHSPKARREAYRGLFAKVLKEPLLRQRRDFSWTHAIGQPSWVFQLAKSFGLVSKAPG